MKCIILLFTLLLQLNANAQDTASARNGKAREHFNFDNKIKFPSRHCNATIQGLHRMRDFGAITLVTGGAYLIIRNSRKDLPVWRTMTGLGCIVGGTGLVIGTFECLGGLVFDAAHGFRRMSFVIDDKGAGVAYNFR